MSWSWTSEASAVVPNEDPHFRPTGKCGVPGMMGAEKTQRSRAAKWTEAPALRQSGVRAASPPPSDEESPGPGRAAGLCPRAAHRSLRRPPRSRERRGPAGRSRRGTPGRAGRWGALESGRGRGGSRSRDLWDARFGGGRTPKMWPPWPAECTEGTPRPPRPPALLALLRLGSPLPPPQVKTETRVSDAGPPTHEVGCESRFVLPTDPAKVPASDALGWPYLGVVQSGAG